MNCCEAASQSPECIRRLAPQWGGVLLPALTANLAPTARTPETGFHCINLLTKLAPHLLALERSTQFALRGASSKLIFTSCKHPWIFEYGWEKW